LYYNITKFIIFKAYTKGKNIQLQNVSVETMKLVEHHKVGQNSIFYAVVYNSLLHGDQKIAF